uniref:Uncharacterized protein n=1 Tax=Arundo donax TaxID=35708 RepID=A0A0A9ECE7_ARUDO
MPMLVPEQESHKLRYLLLAQGAS